MRAGEEEEEYDGDGPEDGGEEDADGRRTLPHEVPEYRSSAEDSQAADGRHTRSHEVHEYRSSAEDSQVQGSSFEWAADGTQEEGQSEGSHARLITDLEDNGQPQVTMMQLEEYLAVSHGLRRSCATLPLTVALWVAYLMVIFNNSLTQTTFESGNFIKDGLEGCSFLAEPGYGGYRKEIRLYDIATFEEILPWVDGALVPMLQTGGKQQSLLGSVRVSQTRGENTTRCANLNSDFQNFYGSGCYPPDGVVSSYGPKRQSFQLPEAAFVPVTGRRNTFELWLEVNRSYNVVSTRVRTLERQNWVDLSTQDITIEGIYLNPQAHVYSKFSVSFLLRREGLVDTNVDVTPLCAQVFTHWSQIFLDIIWLMLHLILMLQAVGEMMEESERGQFWMHLWDPYIWLDGFIVLVGCVIVFLFFFMVNSLKDFESQVARLGSMPRLSVAEAPSSQKVQAGVQATEYQEKLTDLMADFDRYVLSVDAQRFISFFYSLILVGRFLRGFSGQPRMAVLLQSFLYSGSFIVHFWIVFLAIFCNFALAGYILFGEQLQGWSTLGSSLERLFLVLFRRFDYEELHNVAPVNAAIWFTSFFVLVVLLMMRVITAAILHSYTEVRERLGEAGTGLPNQVLGTLRDVWWKRSYEGSQKSIPFHELLALLSADTDPKHVRKLGTLRVDRRLRTRAELHRAERSPAVDEAFLVERGCDPLMARRLLESCRSWTHSISVTSLPEHRLMVLVARQMNYLGIEADKLRDRMQGKFQKTSKVVDRIELKHAKSLALAKRIRRAQTLPPGWTAHADPEGRRYLRQEETGLTSWTLPKHML